MSIKVNSIDVASARRAVAYCTREVRDYISALESNSKRKDDLIEKCIKKLQEASKDKLELIEILSLPDGSNEKISKMEAYNDRTLSRKLIKPVYPDGDDAIENVES